MSAADGWSNQSPTATSKTPATVIPSHSPAITHPAALAPNQGGGPGQSEAPSP
jgi:hypothetical protein